MTVSVNGSVSLIDLRHKYDCLSVFLALGKAKLFIR